MPGSAPALTAYTPDIADLRTLLAIQDMKLSARQLADLGYYVNSGLVLSASGTAGKLANTAGIAFEGTTERNVAANAAITGGDAANDDITELADASNPRWVAVELDVATFRFVKGTAEPVPLFPGFTAARVPLGALAIPAGATNATGIDELLTTDNGKVKLYNLANVRAIHPPRVFHRDIAGTSIDGTVVTAGGATLLAAAPSCPAESLAVGDRFKITASFTVLIPVSTPGAGTAAQVQFIWQIGGVSILNWTSSIATLSTSNSARRVELEGEMVISAIGSGTTGAFKRSGHIFVSDPGGQVPTNITALTSAAAGAGGIGAGTNGVGFDTTGALTMDLRGRFVTSAGSPSSMTCDECVIEKWPA